MPTSSPQLAVGLLLLQLTSLAFGVPLDGPQANARQPGQSKSDYESRGPLGGSKSVGDQLVDDDVIKQPIMQVDFLHEDFYVLKRRIRRASGVELNIDYNFLQQFASFSTDEQQGSSGALRFYGRWFPLWLEDDTNAALVFRIENRHTIGPQTPKQLGFATGSSLSTAGFKDFGWGVTALYWEQSNAEHTLAYVVGQMDPGDFEDIHPLLNPWTAFTNDASFNNPSTALPNQGLGMAAKAFFTDNIYLKGGVHDANGTPTEIDFNSFFAVREYFTWAEAGWSPSPQREAMGESIHLTLWHTDPRENPGVPGGWGLAFSAAQEINDTWIPLVRGGYSEGDATILRAMASVGVGFRLRTSDLFGTAVSWARPPAIEEARDQYTVEAFYRLQLTQNLQLTPGFHLTFKPSYNNDQDTVWVASVIRVRYTL